jgi:hypothetical protein
MKFRFAQSNDVALLAKLNRELIEEEQTAKSLSWQVPPGLSRQNV